jgi:hypothetical protein
MDEVKRRIAREARAMTKRSVIMRVFEGKLTWLQAADILGVTPRHMRRVRSLIEHRGYDAIRDHRGSTPRRKRISAEVLGKICQLRRDKYRDYSVQHFWEKLTEKHGIEIGYTWTKLTLQAAGLAEKASGRGKYRRKRERRPLIGMLVHLDASTHRWIDGLPQRDLMVALDDADGRILYAKFVEQEDTLSTMEALWHVLTRYGRFGALYSDRGSHFCTTNKVGEAPTRQGHVSRALKTLGIRQILAYSPEARGRSERAFGTIQGRLPQELRTEGIRSYSQANAYLQTVFVPDFNRRFTEKPAQSGSAFVPVPKRDLDLVLSIQEERTVGNDNTIRYDGLCLQLMPSRYRPHFVRCLVTVHRLLDESLTVTYQGRRIGHFSADGTAVQTTQIQLHA